MSENVETVWLPMTRFGNTSLEKIDITVMKTCLVSCPISDEKLKELPPYEVDLDN
jgi:hypothetical protein